MNPRFSRIFAAFALVLAIQGLAAAADHRTDLHYFNRLDEEIVGIRVVYATPYDEPRRDVARVFLRPGDDYRIGVQGTIKPEAIVIDLKTKRFSFRDLSPLDPSGQMSLEVAFEDGVPTLRRRDGDGRAKGVLYEYLTIANLPNAIDKDAVIGESSLAGVVNAVMDKARRMQEEMGELEAFSIEAGPIWNNDHARERCPEAVMEWNADNEREARWTGHWRTVKPGEMSECDCLAGTAGTDETLIPDEAGWAGRMFFPVVWNEEYGVGSAMADRATGSAMVEIRIPLPAEGASETLRRLLYDLGLDGYRPLRLDMTAMRADPDGDLETVREDSADFREFDGDASSHIDEILTASYDETAVQGAIGFLTEDDFEAVREGGEISDGRAVICIFAKDYFQAIFMPSGAESLL